VWWDPIGKEVRMIIDCDECAVRGPACGECVVSVLLGSAPDDIEHLELDDAERSAVATLAGAGLIPPLRMVRISTHSEPESTQCRRDVG
jgi:hypothetical protein